ncbi:MAG TPA: MFS transporter [Candidatus Copromorpha excrementigallinarum]|uniref:MFS transporter n=1 Tax=Candidatus Allocopromorpha excrementigallinarum TaxID=2840742 RepID=A0A9D1L5K0_9FIRM|nr:MFS transporter [Candidatus Copromorpha excrementigallinarum]
MNTKVQKQNLGIMATVSLLSAFMIGQSHMMITPIFANISEQFPDLPYSTITWLSTAGSAVATVFTFISSAIAGKKIRYRTLTVLAAALVVLGGCAGAFCLDNFTALLISRLFLAAGFGTALSLVGGYVNAVYRDNPQKCASMQGYGNVVANGATVLYQLLAGFVAVVSLPGVFWLHLILLIPLVLCALFAPEPAKTAEEPEEKEVKIQENGAKDRIPGYAWAILIFNAVSWTFFNPVLTLISGLIADEGIGDSATSSIVSIMYTVGGVIAGLIFGIMFKKMKRAVSPVAQILWVLGMLVVVVSHSPAGLIAGFLIHGLGFYLVWPISLMHLGTVPESRQTLVIGLFATFLNIGAFASTPYIKLVENVTGNSDPRFCLIISTIGMAVSGLLWIIASARVNKNLKYE